jgi:hypothetical protein
MDKILVVVGLYETYCIKELYFNDANYLEDAFIEDKMAWFWVMRDINSRNEK